ncbi:MAG TPA: exo-beta-N-acetylmuramidase NamZ domain-containing protein, partial [Dissulfurispiraceae bacterium]|nr:exo-beta-N-acetylmuramidase NamZ domain-containing protein [Dissulfurispiraceae bacterium]
MTKTGLDRVERNWPRALTGTKVGLLVHPASVNKRLQHASTVLLQSRKLEVKAFFGPQHGIRGETQDNMVEWKGFLDRRTGLPVYSLYSETRKPRTSALKELDALVVDLQDVGARYYTFVWTMELCMQACAETGKPVV